MNPALRVATLSLILSFTQIAFPQTKVTVLSGGETVDAPHGHHILRNPNLNGTPIKTVTEGGTVEVAAYTQTAEGTFYISKWSWERYKNGNITPNWVFVIPGEKQMTAEAATASYPDTSYPGYFEEYGNPQTVIFPIGYILYPEPTSDSKVTKLVDGYRVVTVTGCYDEPLDANDHQPAKRFYRSDRGWIYAQSGDFYGHSLPESVQTNRVDFDRGYAILGGADINAPILQIVERSATLDIGGSLESYSQFEGGVAGRSTFLVTQWSMDQMKLGRRPTFVVPLENLGLDDVGTNYERLRRSTKLDPVALEKAINLARNSPSRFCKGASCYELSDAITIDAGWCSEREPGYYEELEDILDTLAGYSLPDAIRYLERIERYCEASRRIAEARLQIDDRGVDQSRFPDLVSTVEAVAYDTVFSRHPSTFQLFSGASQSYVKQLEWTSPFDLEAHLTIEWTSGQAQSFEVEVPKHIAELPEEEGDWFLESLPDVMQSIVDIWIHNLYAQTPPIESPRGTGTQLQKGEVFVEFLRYPEQQQPSFEPGYYGIRIHSPGGGIVEEKLFAAKSFDSFVELMLRNFTKRRIGVDSSSSITWLDGFFTEVYEKTFGRFQSSFKGAEKIYWKGDGYFQLVPLDLMVMRSGGGDGLDRIPMVQITSSKALGVHATTRAVWDGTESILFVGNPAFNEHGASPGVADSSPGAADASFASRIARSFQNRSIQFGQLPGSEEEVVDIAGRIGERVGANRVDVLVGSEATELEIRNRLEVSAAAHFATHGFFLDSTLSTLTGDGEIRGFVDSIEDPYLKSGLAFTGCNPTLKGWVQNHFPDPSNDGVLLASEIRDMDLSSLSLIVLSACSTAEGKPMDGRSAVGLHSAIMESGAENLVATLWEIPDEFTVKVMKGFYEELLSGKEVGESIWNTKRALYDDFQRENKTLTRVVTDIAPFVSLSSAVR
jgi:hypothetical protein